VTVAVVINEAVMENRVLTGSDWLVLGLVAAGNVIQFGGPVMKALKNTKIGGKLSASLAGMRGTATVSDDIARGIAQNSDDLARIGNKAFGAGWADDVTKMIVANGDDFAKSMGNIAKTYGDDVAASTMKGLRDGVIKNMDEADALAKYIKAVKKIDGVADPINDLGIHKLVKMSETTKMATTVGDDVIDGFVVLKKGQHLGPHRGFGLDHITTQHGDEFVGAGLKTNDDIIKAIDNTISDPSKHYIEGNMHIFESKSLFDGKVVKVFVRSDGSIQTARVFRP